MAASTFQSNLQSGFANAHGWGSNVWVIASTVTATAETTAAIESLHGQENLKIKSSVGLVGTSTSYADALADVFKVLSFDTNWSGTSGTGVSYYYDTKHPNSLGYNLWANVVANTILQPNLNVTDTSQGNIYFNAGYGKLYLYNWTAGNSYVNWNASSPYGPESVTISTYPCWDFYSGATLEDEIDASGNFAFQVAGQTVKIKGGSNAASGTVTLVAGTGTITSTAITTSSVMFLSLKASSGAPGTYTPLTTVGTGTCVVNGLSTDNSTYNWGLVLVNQ